MAIGISLSILIIIGIMVYLYRTKRLSLIYLFKWKSFLQSFNKLEKLILSGSLITVFLLNFFTNIISSFIYGYIAPSYDKAIFENTNKLQGSLKNEFSKTNLKLDKLLDKSSIDPRNIGQYLKELPYKNGKEEKVAKIEEWYNTRKISADEKELLFVVINALYEQSEVLSHEITNLKLTGKNEFAEVLENIQKHFDNRDANKIRDDYLLSKKKLEKDNIFILKQSIYATEALFAFKETNELYLELLTLEKTSENYFEYARFLQEFNSLDDSELNFKLALEIARNDAKIDPDTNLPVVLAILNNLGNVHLLKNDFLHAQEKYVEALKLGRELCKNDPDTYQIIVVTTLNSFASLQMEQNATIQAYNNYKEALKILHELSKSDKSTYVEDMALIYNNLGVLKLRMNEFSEATGYYEEALKIYKELSIKDSITYISVVAGVYENLAVIHSNRNEFDYSGPM